jgi:transcriptional regulator with XRE-family HTH domain
MIGERLRLLREEKELTQQQIANGINSTQQKISNYEKDIVEPDCETLIKLANFFNTTTDYILGRTNLQYQGEMTSVYHQNTPIADLPEEAIMELKVFTEYLAHKYKKSDRYKSSPSSQKNINEK